MVTLINRVDYDSGKGSTIILPSDRTDFQVYGNNTVEKITIIYSPEVIPQLSPLERGNISTAEWQALKTGLVEESKIIMAEQHEKPFSIGGNTRVLTKRPAPFTKKLRIYSGKGFLIKSYEFKIKK
ncbi:MAG: hypothetical protein MI863_00495, partial [Desulfobacterales bacterium]|nr:hypothetical protein [Desulfobacterales bacterium]